MIEVPTERGCLTESTQTYAALLAAMATPDSGDYRVGAGCRAHRQWRCTVRMEVLRQLQLLFVTGNRNLDGSEVLGVCPASVCRYEHAHSGDYGLQNAHTVFR